MKLFRDISLILAVFTLLQGCSSSSDPSPASGCTTQKSQLTGNSSKTWDISQVNVPLTLEDNSGNVLLTTTYNVLSLPSGIDLSNLDIDFECVSDNSVTFKNDDTFIASEGTNVCNGIPANNSGTWALNSSCDTLLLSSSDSLAFVPVGGIPISTLSDSRLTSKVSIDLDTVYKIPVSQGIIQGNLVIGEVLNIEVVFDAQ